MAFLIGTFVALGCMLGGFAGMGGHLAVIFQPWEFVIILGVSFGTFIVANSLATIKDTGAALVEAILERGPTQRDYLDVLGVLYTLMRELRGKARSEVEQHVDNPSESAIFKSFPKVLADANLTSFICDYCRLIIIGNARTHEIEALMDEEIETVTHDRLKPYHALTSVADGLPAIGIVAAVLGVVHAMGALDQSPEILGGLIGAALVGTFTGIFVSYGVVAPLANKVKLIFYSCGRAARGKPLILFGLRGDFRESVVPRVRCFLLTWNVYAPIMCAPLMSRRDGSATCISARRPRAAAPISRSSKAVAKARKCASR